MLKKPIMPWSDTVRGAEENRGISLTTSDGEQLVIHWFNSRLKLFEDSEFDHVEYYQDGRTLALRVGRAIMDIMMEEDFPQDYDPVVDECTFNWYVNLETKNMDQELKELFDGEAE